MNEHVSKLNDKLRGIFETKAAEFNKYSQENPKTAAVTTQIAGMYEELAAVFKQ